MCVIRIPRPALGPTQPHVQWVLWVLSSGAKQPGHEADFSRLPDAEVNDEWGYRSAPPHALMVCTGTALSFQG
jgi:hypothetical protein